MERENNAGIELIQPLLLYRSWILLGAILCAIVVLVLKIVSPTEYKASVVVSATSTNKGISGQIGQLSGLASLAGVSIGGDREGSDFDNFMYLVTSPELAYWQLQRRPILSMLYPNWDDKTKSWRPSSSVGEFMSLLKGPKQTPTPYDIEDIYRKQLTIAGIFSFDTKAGKTNLVKLTYTHTDPKLAKEFLRYIVEDSNEILRNRAAIRATIQASYLRSQLEKVTVQEYRETLERLLSEQEQTLMLTNSHLPYAASPLSGQEVPPERVPKRTLMMSLLGAAIGFSIAYFIAIVVFYIRRPDQEYAEYEGNRTVPVLPYLSEWVRGAFRGRSRSRVRDPQSVV